jgi:hypothetical protein
LSTLQKLAEMTRRSPVHRRRYRFPDTQTKPSTLFSLGSAEAPAGSTHPIRQLLGDCLTDPCLPHASNIAIAPSGTPIIPLNVPETSPLLSTQPTQSHHPSSFNSSKKNSQRRKSPANTAAFITAATSHQNFVRSYSSIGILEKFSSSRSQTLLHAVRHP